VYGTANDAGTDATSLTSTASGAATFRAINTGTNNALEGAASAGTGVYGSTSGSNAGVFGEGTGSGTGVVAASASGVAFKAAITSGSAAGAHLELQPHGSVSGVPTGAAHNAGQFFMDSNATLYQCIVTNNPGVWIKHAPLVMLTSPVRVYDSRTGQPNQAPNTQGSLTFTSAPPTAAFRDVACNKNASSGATVVPANARTLLMNLAIVSISGVGALNAYATGTTQPATANINWFAGGQVLSNAVTSACSATQHVDFAIVASSGAATHFIVDVIGYYL
jgi:hypothetical protein